MKEADITISGTPLTEGQSLTVRVALQTFAMTISDALEQQQSDARTARLHRAYLERIGEINELLAKTAR